jgi:hypothetical protein
MEDGGLGLALQSLTQFIQKVSKSVILFTTSPLLLYL